MLIDWTVQHQRVKLQAPVSFIPAKHSLTHLCAQDLQSKDSKLKHKLEGIKLLQEIKTRIFAQVFARESRKLLQPSLGRMAMIRIALG